MGRPRLHTAHSDNNVVTVNNKNYWKTESTRQIFFHFLQSYT